MMSLYEDIQDRMDGVSVYSNYFACNCVFHDDTKPSMFVYEDLDREEGKGKFYCSGCGKSGTHAYLWKFLTGAEAKVSIPGRQVQKFLPAWKRWEERFGSIENLVQYAHENVLRHPYQDWYIKKRQLTPVYKPCKLGYMDEWLFFPIFDPQGKIVDVIVRDTKGRSKYIIHPNDEETPLLYVPNWKRVMESKTIFIVYGLIDALALEMCQLPVITGSTGKSLSEKRLIQLNKKWVIIPDKNEDDAARKLAKSLGNFTRIVRLPYEDDTKDCDDIRMKHGLDYLKSLINL
jgi:DNA primase